MYSAKHWTREAVSRLKGEYDLQTLRQEATWVRDYKVAQWCDATLADMISRQAASKASRERSTAKRREERAAKALSEQNRLDRGLVPEVRGVIAHERLQECGVVDVSEHGRTFWVRKA